MLSYWEGEIEKNKEIGKKGGWGEERERGIEI